MTAMTWVNSILPTGAFLFLGPLAVEAQEPVPRDLLIFGTAGSAFRILDTTTWGEIGGQSLVNGYWRFTYTGTLDERGFLYGHFGDPWPSTTFSELSRWGRDASLPSSQWLSANPPWRFSLGSSLNQVGYLAATRDAVVSLLPDGRFARLLKDVGNQVIVHLGPALPPGVTTGQPLVNGRELFTVVGASMPVPNAAYYCDVFAQDLSVASPSRRLVAHIASPWGCCGFALGRDGLLYVAVIGAILEIDPVTGTTVATRPIVWPSASPPDLLSGLAYDPWSDRAVMAETSNVNRTTFVWSQLHAIPVAWNLAYTSLWYYTIGYPYDGLYRFAFTNEQPFEYFGTGCSNALGLEPRLGWQGMPLHGQAFSLTLRDAEPNGFAVMWLGWSDTLWGGVGPLPIDGGAFGAPGCRLLVAPDGPTPIFVDGNGRATYRIAVPNSVSIAGMQLYAQSLSSSGANALGFSSSDALVIRFR